MKIMLDTNILISAALFPNGVAAKSYHKALAHPFEPMVCDYILDELRRKFREKFPDRSAVLEAFLKEVAAVIHVVAVPNEECSEETRIRDIKDRPILRAAMSADVHFLLTGDKDFLEAHILKPKIIGVTEFLSMP